MSKEERFDEVGIKLMEMILVLVCEDVENCEN